MAAVLSEGVLDQNGSNWSNDHFGQIDLIANRLLAFARPKWTKMANQSKRYLETNETVVKPYSDKNRCVSFP